MGIRPLFYGYTKYSKEIAFASEAKALIDICDIVKPFPLESILMARASTHSKPTTKTIVRIFQDEKKALAGCIKSGGLDSSLVCAIA